MCTCSGDKQELYKQVDKLCFSEQIMGLVCVTFCVKQLILKLYTKIIIGHINNNLLQTDRPSELTSGVWQISFYTQQYGAIVTKTFSQHFRLFSY